MPETAENDEVAYHWRELRHSRHHAAVAFAPVDYYDPSTGGYAATKPAVDQREQAVIALLRPFCDHDNGALLDIGCGSGLFLSALDAELSLTRRGWELHGVDYSQAQVDAARQHPYRFCQCNVEAGLPFPDQSFDVVFCGELVEHLYDPDSFLGECRRILIPNGHIAITTPNLHAWYNRVLFAAGIQPLFYESSTRTTAIGAGPLRRFKRGTTPVGHLRVFGHRALCDLLDSQGFRVTADRGAEFVLLPTPLRLVDRMFNRAPSLASILVVTAESVEGPNKPRHLRAVTPLSIEEPESLEDEQEGPADPPRSSESSLGRLPRDPKVRSPWIVGTGLTLAGIAAFAVAVVLVEAFSDRDWRLSGMEWPTDFVTAALLVFLVPLVLFGLQLLLNVRTKLRDARASRV